MAFLINKIEKFSPISVGLTSIEQLDSVPAPDTEQIDAELFGYTTEIVDLESFNIKSTTYFESTFLHQNQPGLNNIAQLDTVPSPDTILLDFAGFSYATEPFYPAAQSNGTGITPGNGDIISYIS